MKKLFLISLLFSLFMLDIVSGQEQEEDLYIRIEALKERQYSSTALTDQYETEILTAKSSEYSKQINKIREENTKRLIDRLFLNIEEKESHLIQIQEQTVNAGLFADGYKAKSKTGNIIQRQTNIIMVFAGTMGCIMAGYFLAVVRRRIGEKRK